MFKKNKETVKKELENAADDVMQEVDEEFASQFSGAGGNPFENRPRVGLQAIDDELRNKG